MSEPKLIFKVELMDEAPKNGSWPLRVTIGISNEALLALAMRKVELVMYEQLTKNEMIKEDAAKSDIIIPSTEVPAGIIDRL